MRQIKLSICIATYNRAGLLRETLESILPQLTPDCEVVIADDASPDNTSDVVSGYVQRHPNLRYIRHEKNKGLDHNYDFIVGAAQGQYCWLMTDDDIVLPGAVERVLGLLQRDISLIVVNAERRDPSASKVLLSRIYDIEADRTYAPDEADQLFIDGKALVPICLLVIDRALWLSRNRARYYGSVFIHIGVIFEAPLPHGALLVADSLVGIRDGHTRTFWPRYFELYMINLPTLVWSLPLSDAAKSSVCTASPWKDAKELLLHRALGWYGFAEYRKWIHPRIQSFRERLAVVLIAFMPGRWANAWVISRYEASGSNEGRVWIQLLKQSRFYRSVLE